MNQHNGFFQVDTERLEREARRDMDFADRLVIWASAVIGASAIFIVVYIG